jgi:hypothetical protein
MKPPTEIKNIGTLNSSQDSVLTECDRETIALLHILALGEEQIKNGQTMSLKEAFTHIRKRQI